MHLPSQQAPVHASPVGGAGEPCRPPTPQQRQPAEAVLFCSVLPLGDRTLAVPVPDVMGDVPAGGGLAQNMVFLTQAVPGAESAGAPRHGGLFQDSAAPEGIGFQSGHPLICSCLLLGRVAPSLHCSARLWPGSPGTSGWGGTCLPAVCRKAFAQGTEGLSCHTMDWSRAAASVQVAGGTGAPVLSLSISGN